MNHFLFYLLQKPNEGSLFAPDRLFKVVLVGNSSVGKTSLLRSFCEGRFHPSTIATVGEKEKTLSWCCVVCTKAESERRVCAYVCLWMLTRKIGGGDLASHERACEVTLPVWEPWHTLYCRLCHFWRIFLLAFIFSPNHSPKPCCLHFVPLPFTLKWCPLVVISVFVALWKNCGFKLNTRSAATFFCYNTPCLYCVDLDQVLITVWRH